jgi:serine/threonine protein phosphatase 1
MVKNQYIIGDVHGEFDTLLTLIEKLSLEHELIFVGDLIDRGPKSKEVIAYIKNNAHCSCVLGNHEELMIEYGDIFIQAFFNNHDEIPFLCSRWIKNGGKETLMSYDLAHTKEGKLLIKYNQTAIYEFIEDINWLKSLPIYLQLNTLKNNKPIIITHASASDVWHLHDDEENQDVFRKTALWNRIEPITQSKIFNIYGHTPVEEVNLNKHFLNIDTGCTYGLEMGFGELTAYCIQTQELVQQKRIRHQ